MPTGQERSKKGLDAVHALREKDLLCFVIGPVRSSGLSMERLDVAGARQLVRRTAFPRTGGKRSDSVSWRKPAAR